MTLMNCVPFRPNRLWSLWAIRAVNDLATFVVASSDCNERARNRGDAWAPVPTLTAASRARATTAREIRPKGSPFRWDDDVGKRVNPSRFAGQRQVGSPMALRQHHVRLADPFEVQLAGTED